MDVPTRFFLAILAVQLGFTGTLVWLVARRFARRLPLYRFVAPAGVPLLMFALVLFSFLNNYDALRAAPNEPFHPSDLSPLFPILLAYLVLWLVGILFASMVIRWTRR